MDRVLFLVQVQHVCRTKFNLPLPCRRCQILTTVTSIQNILLPSSTFRSLTKIHVILQFTFTFTLYDGLPQRGNDDALFMEALYDDQYWHFRFGFVFDRLLSLDPPIWSAHLRLSRFWGGGSA